MLVLGHFFFLGIGHGLDMKWVGVANSFGPTTFIENMKSYQKNQFFSHKNVSKNVFF